MFSLGTLFANLFSHSAQITTDGAGLVAGFEQEYQDIAHGEGGVGKVAKALAQSSAITSSLSKMLADLTQAPSPPPAPPAA